MRTLFRWLSIVAAGLACQNAWAADIVWSGAGPGSNFATGGNWVGGTPPGSNDRAIFPVGPANKIITVTVPVTLQAIVMQDCGYQFAQLSSSSVTLTTATPVSVTCDTNAGVNIIGGNPVTLTAGSPTVVMRTTGGAVGATATLQLGVTNGVSFDGQITFDPAQTTTGREPRIQSRVIEQSIGSVRKIGNGILLFNSANSYAGQTQVLSGVLEVGNNAALGSSSLGTVVTTPGEIHLNAAGLDVDTEPLELVDNSIIENPILVARTSARWGGPILFSGSAPIANRTSIFEVRNTTLNIGGALSGSSHLRIQGTTGTGTVALNANGNYTGRTELFSNSRLLVNSASNRLPDTTLLSFNGGAFEFTTTGGDSDDIAGIAGSGSITLSSNAVLRLMGDPDYSYSGTITGQGIVRKFGLGTWTFTGISSQTGAGSINVREGILELTNIGNTMTMLVEDIGSLVTDASAETGPLLGGSAVLSNLNPGGDAAYGILTVSGNFNTGTQLTTRFDFAGNNPGVDHDRIAVPTPANTVSVGGIVLVTVPNVPTIGTSAVLIDNAGADAITGTFSGLAEGAVRNIGGNFYSFSYIGGDGNDFTITRIAAPLFIWDGGGADNNWTTAANWVGDVAPVVGAELEFPSSAARKTNTNSFAAASTFTRITVAEGYVLGGNSFLLSDPVSPIRFRNTNPGTHVSRINNTITLLGAASQIDYLNQQASGSFTAIVGTPAGPLNFSGTLTLLNGRSSPATSNLNIENLVEQSPGSNVVVSAQGTFAGTVEFPGPNTYSGTTLLEPTTTLVVRNASALGTNDGTPATGTTIEDATLASITSGTPNFNEHLTILDTAAPTQTELAHIGGAGTQTTFSGPIVLAPGTTSPRFGASGNGVLNLAGPISGTATRIELSAVLPTSEVRLANPANSYTAETRVAGGLMRLSGSNVIPDNSLVNLSVVGARLIVNGNSETIGGLQGNGTVDIDGSLSNLIINNAVMNTFTGAVIGATPGRITKNGTGTLVMSGNRSAAGQEVANAGIYDIQSSTTAAQLRIGNGIVIGEGSVASLVNDSPASTGLVGPTPGAVLTSGNVSLASAVTLRSFLQSGQLGRVNVTGSVTLSNSLLLVTHDPVTLGTELTVISNDLSDPVVGGFSGQPNNSYVTSSGTIPQSFRIRYNGGDGNDVTVVREEPVLTWDGGGSDNNWSTPANWVGDIAPTPGTGATLVFPSVAARKTNINDFAPPVIFQRLDIAEGYAISGNALTLNDAVTAIRFRNSSNGAFVSTVSNVLNLSGSNTSIDFLSQQTSGNFTASIGTPTNAVNFTGTLVLLAGRDSGAVNAQLWVQNLAEQSPGSGLVLRQQGGILGATTDFRGPNSYSGTTLVEPASVLVVRTAGALGTSDGTPAAGTIVQDAALISAPVGTVSFNEHLELVDVVGGVPPLLRHLAGVGTSTTFSAPVVLSPSQVAQVSALPDGDLNLTGPISGSGSVLEVDLDNAGRVQLGSTSNSFTGVTRILSGRLGLLASNVIPNASVVDIAVGGTLNMNGFQDTVSGLQGVGAIDLSGASSELVVDTAAPRIFGGTLVGSSPGRLTKTGPGTLTMSGNRTFAGDEVVQAGQYNIGSSTTTAQVRVDNGVLVGQGGVGNLNNVGPSSAGFIEPSAGQAMTTGSVSLGGSIGLRSMLGGGQLGRLATTGTVAISGNAALDILTDSPVAPSTELVVIANDGAEPITGAFTGRANNSYFISSGTAPQSFRIRYGGGDGNDVTVVREAAPDIVTLTLASGTVGIPYSQNLSATGGELDYAFDLAAGSLPPGLSITNLMSFGTLSGTPTVPGTYNFDLRVTDNNGNTDVQALTLVINGPTTLVWDGGGSDNNWTTAANWVGDVAPVPGPTTILEFPEVAARKTNVNDFPANSSFSGLRVIGPDYQISGAGILLGSGALAYTATSTSGADSSLNMNVQLVSPIIDVRTTGAGPRNRLLINPSPSPHALLVNAIELQVLLVNTDSGPAVPEVSIGRVTFGGGYGGDISVDGNPGRVTLFESNHSGRLTVVRGTVRAQTPLAFGTGDGSAPSGTEVLSGGFLDVAGNTVIPPMERIFLHNNQGMPRPVLVLENNVEASGEISFGGDVDILANGAVARLTGPLTGSSNVLFGSLIANGEIRVESPLNAWSGGLSVAPSLTLRTTGPERIPDGVSVSVASSGRLRLDGGGVETLADLDVTGELRLGTTQVVANNVQFFVGANLVTSLNGTTPGTNQSQIVANGTVDLTGAALGGSSAGVVYGSALTLIANDFSDAVNNTFVGVAEDTDVTVGGVNYRVRYGAGDGNDVQLYRIDPLTITTASLPSGAQGVSYGPVPVAVTGGQPSYSYVATGLPPGLAINPGTGEISGTPTASGSFSVTVTVTDSFGTPANTATRNLSLPVGALTLSVTADAVTAESGNVSFDVTLSGAGTVNFTTVSGTALAGSDFVALSGPLSFAAAGTQSVTIPITPDNVVEAAEQFTVDFSSPGATPANLTRTVTINNDDSTVVTLGPISQSEGDSGNTPFVVPVTLSNPVQGPVTLSILSVDGTATSPGDFASISQPLNIASLATVGPDVVAQIVGDTSNEPDESFVINGNVITAPLGIPFSAITIVSSTVTILNDDSEATTTTLGTITPANVVVFPGTFTPTVQVRGTATRPAGTLRISAALAPDFKSVIQCVASTSNGPGALDINGGCALTPSSPGIWRVRADFQGGAGYQNSGSTSQDYTVSTTSSVGSIVQSSTTTVVGEPFTVTVTLVGASAHPYGNVTVLPIPVGSPASCALTPTQEPNTSSCAATVVSPAAVSKLLRVTFEGSGEPVPVFPPFQVAQQQAHDTQRANTIPLITAAGPDPSQIGQSLEARYQVTVRAPGAATTLAPLNGQVEVSDGVDRCIGTLTPAGPVATGSCNLSLSTAGNRILTARYLGNENYFGATSLPETQTVVAAGTGPDLSVQLGNGLSTVNVGSPVQYRLRVRNSGPAAANNARVQMAIPNGLTGVSWTCTATPPSLCPASGTGAIDQLVTLAQPGAIPSMVEFVVSGTAPSVEGVLSAAASVQAPAGSTDPNLTNNTTSDADTVGVFGTGFETIETE